LLGQLITLFTIFFVFNFTIPLTECLFVVSLSILVNFYSYFIQRGNSTLTDKKTFLFLLFDISQLVGLLFLTGGVFNPFVVLILAPIIISASYLSALWTISPFIIFNSILILIINFNYIPLNWEQNFVTPPIYNIGILVALIITIIFVAIYAYLFAKFC
jgi:two-component system sensor histidine kinase RegB